MPPGSSFKVCPGCGFHNQIQIGHLDELQYFRVMLLDRDQKDFFCKVDCFQKYLKKTYNNSSKLNDDLLYLLNSELKQTRLKFALEKEKENRQKISNYNNNNYKLTENPTDFKNYQYNTKRRSSHVNTKTNVVDIYT